MRVFNDLNHLPKFNNAVLTIGSFDGVHHGHQQILDKVNTLAKNIDGESIVITFHPHPRLVIYPKDKSLRLLSTIDEKVELLRHYGIDNLVIVPFSIEFSQQSADEYIQKFLVEKFLPKQIVIGYDHRFGLNRQGDINYLKWHGQKQGFEVIEIEKQAVEEMAVSSTKVRQAIEQGAVSNAYKLLNHYYSMTGLVVKGQQIGHTIGFPTANLEIDHPHKLIPPNGIYAVFVWHSGQRYSGMLYIGNRPTIDGVDNRTIEVNIFDFKQTIYGDTLKIELIDFIRHDEKYPNLEGLKAQLFKDKAASLRIISEVEKLVVKKAEPLPAVAVVILNYNTRQELAQFLPSVLATDYDNFRVIVADNGSVDDSLNFLKETYPEIELIELKDNHGFAKGYNLALQQIDSEYFILLNSDVAVTPNWMMPIIQLMENDPTIGAAQPKIRSYQQKDHFEYAGAAGGFIDDWGYPFCRGRILSSLEQDEGQYDQDKEVFWASGAAFFVRAKLFKQLGGFDEDFFMHMEEIEFCWRLKRAGYRVFACSQAMVYHVGGSALDYLSPFKTYLNFRNSLFTILKNESRQKLLWLIPLRLVLDGFAAGLFLVEGKFAHIKAILKAHFSFYGRFANMRKKRAANKALIEKIRIQREMNRVGVLPKSIVLQYYLKGIREFSKLKF